MLKLCVPDRRFDNKRWACAKRKNTVISVTRTNGSKIYINAELIQTVESTPDTVITLTSNKKLLVKDTAQEIAERFIEYRRKTLAPFNVDKPGQ
jgi:flagellar protein FlbD